MDNNERLELARDWYNDQSTTKKEKVLLENLFPEIIVSKDERIRKEITELVMQPTWKTEKEFHRRKELVAWLEKQGEQKPAWSDDDEIGYNGSLWAIKQARTIAKNENDMGDLWFAERWLKSIKDRVQPKQEWSKDDEDAIGMAIEALEDLYDEDDPSVSFTDHYLTFAEAAERLKALKPKNFKQ